MRVPSIFTAFVSGAVALGQAPVVNFDGKDDSLFLADAQHAISIHVDANDWAGVIRAAENLAQDFGRVTGLNGTVIRSNNTMSYGNPSARGPGMIIAGTIGHSSVIDGLVEQGQLNVSFIQGQWEAFYSVVIQSPIEGVQEALVIAGEYTHD